MKSNPDKENKTISKLNFNSTKKDFRLANGYKPKITKRSEQEVLADRPKDFPYLFFK